MGMYDRKYDEVYDDLEVAMINNATKRREEEARAKREAEETMRKMKEAAEKEKSDPWNLVGAIGPGALSMLGTIAGAAAAPYTGGASLAIGSGLGNAMGQGLGMAANQFGYKAPGMSMPGNVSPGPQQSSISPGQLGLDPQVSQMMQDAGMQNPQNLYGQHSPGGGSGGQDTQAQAAKSNIGAAFLTATPQLLNGAGQILGNVAGVMNSGPTDFELEEIRRMEEAAARERRMKGEEDAFNMAFGALHR